eukprot:1161375-Pelagomonas_calceolata.AAC.5
MSCINAHTCVLQSEVQHCNAARVVVRHADASSVVAWQARSCVHALRKHAQCKGGGGLQGSSLAHQVMHSNPVWQAGEHACSTHIVKAVACLAHQIIHKYTMGRHACGFAAQRIKVVHKGLHPLPASIAGYSSHCLNWQMFSCRLSS